MPHPSRYSHFPGFILFILHDAELQFSLKIYFNEVLLVMILLKETRLRYILYRHLT